MARPQELLGSVLVLCALYAVTCHEDIAQHNEDCIVLKQWRKLNGDDPVCFEASDNGHGEFTVQHGMAMDEVKFVRRSGHHECMIGYGGYFGCEAYLPHDHHESHHALGVPHYHAGHHDARQRDEVNADAPRAPAMDRSPGSFFMQQISLYMTDEMDHMVVPQPPYLTPYYTVPSINRPAWQRSITVPVNNGPFEVYFNQKLRLYHGEDLFDVNSIDNTGTLCVDVYAYGDTVFDMTAFIP